jgi:hypothetical protein
MVATAVESVPSFQDADPSFGADAPSLASAEPALAFVRAPRGRLRATPWEHDAADRRSLFVGRGAEPAIAGGEVL